MSHEKSATFEENGKHFVANTAGFSSPFGGADAERSKKNRKKKKTKFYDTEDEAQLESSKRSMATDSVRNRNSQNRPSTGFNSQLNPTPHTDAMHKLIKTIRKNKTNG